MIGRPWSETSPTDKDIEIDYGGVDVIALATCPKTGARMVLVEKIYRIPIGKFVLSFPAGFKDATDANPGVTAVRELKEETGYVGKAIFWYKSHRPDPWKSSERAKMVKVEVDLTTPENKNPTPNFEASEDIYHEWF